MHEKLNMFIFFSWERRQRNRFVISEGKTHFLPWLLRGRDINVDLLKTEDKRKNTLHTETTQLVCLFLVGIKLLLLTRCRWWRSRRRRRRPSSCRLWRPAEVRARASSSCAVPRTRAKPEAAPPPWSNPAPPTPPPPTAWRPSSAPSPRPGWSDSGRFPAPPGGFWATPGRRRPGFLRKERRWRRFCPGRREVWWRGFRSQAERQKRVILIKEHKFYSLRS